MVKFKFVYKKKEFNIDVKECRTIFQKTHGLMFRRKSKPLLFIFKKPVNEGIHSFFCVPFVAIWLLGDKIIEVKYVRPFRFYVKPKQKFDKFLEIPNTDVNFKFFLDN